MSDAASAESAVVLIPLCKADALKEALAVGGIEIAPLLSLILDYAPTRARIVRQPHTSDLCPPSPPHISSFPGLDSGIE